MNRAKAVFLCLFLSGIFSVTVRADLRAGADVTDITPLPEDFPISTTGSMAATFIDGTDESISPPPFPGRW